MSLVDMARDKKKNKESESIIDYVEDKYPYGLRINLNEEEIEKLGLKTLPKVGEEIRIEAMVCVSEVSERESVDGGTFKRLSLQIEKLGFMAEDKKSAAEKMYGKKEES